MFAKCPAGRPGTADEVANVAELLMSDRGAFITGADFLIDGGATASYFYGPIETVMCCTVVCKVTAAIRGQAYKNILSVLQI